MRLTIRWKLILSIVVPLAAVSSVWLWTTFERNRAEAVERTRQMLMLQAEAYAARMDGKFTVVAQIGRAMASYLDSLETITEADLYEMLSRNVGEDPLIYGSCVSFMPHTFDPQRRLFAPYVYRGSGKETTPPDSRGLYRMDVANAYDYMDEKWEWFHAPRRSGKAMWTEPFFDEGAGDVVMCTYVTPFFRNGQFRGTVNMDIRLEDLHALEMAGQVGQGLAILSRTGRFVHWPDRSAIMNDTIEDLAQRTGRADLADMGRRMIAGESGTVRMLDVDSPTPLLIAYGPLPSTGWSYALAVPEDSLMEPVYAALRERILAAAGTVGLLTTVLLVAGVWIARPIERLAEAVRTVGTGQFEGVRAEVRSRDEIGDLARAFDDMVAQLRKHVRALTRETRARESVESELRVAREIQTSLLPRTFPPFPDRSEFSLHAVNAAARRVAGDFYDFFFVPDGRLALVIADVSGKGVPAALLMAVARTIIRNLAAKGDTPAALLREANRLLLADNDRGMFVTLFIAFYDPSTGRATYANAGHPLPIVLGHDGSQRRFGTVTGTILGAIDGPEYSEATDRLGPGERLVMYTDGVPEAREAAMRPGSSWGTAGASGSWGATVAGRARGPMFGEPAFAALLREVAERPVDAMCDEIVARLDAFQGGDRADDVTVMILARNGVEARAEVPDQQRAVANTPRDAALGR